MVKLAEPKKIITLTVSPKEMANGASFPVSWTRKTICRRCGGTGCEVCGPAGYIEQKVAKTISMPDASRAQNGSWCGFIGQGDEAEDQSGCGDAAVVLHVAGMAVPEKLEPRLGAMYGDASELFIPPEAAADFNLPGGIPGPVFSSGYQPNPGGTMVRIRLKLKPSEARSGCVKPVVLNVLETCDGCRDGAGTVEASCPSCKGSGMVKVKKTLPVTVPPNTPDGALIWLDQTYDMPDQDGKPVTVGVMVLITLKKFLFF